MSRLRFTSAVLVVGMLAAACGSDGGSEGASGASGGSGLTAITASVDLYTEDPQRVAFGLVMPDNNLVSFGTVDVAFSLVGTAAEASEPKPGPTTTASFVPVFGTPDRSSGPVVTSPSKGRGVYEATDVVFDTAGFWVADITADIEGLGAQKAATTFAVLEQPQLPAPGDKAMPTRNLTVDSKGVPEAAIDSRAAESGEIPDPELHATTIADAIRRGRPAVVVFATPVYCVSRFCGPVTNMVEKLARRYEDRAVFIHVEIWKDFQNQKVNGAATEWLRTPDGNITEPWLFLIRADGTISDRWSAMWSEQDVAKQLDRLPPMDGQG